MEIKNNKSAIEKVIKNGGQFAGPKKSDYKFNTISMPIMGSNLQVEIKAGKQKTFNTSGSVSERFLRTVSEQQGNPIIDSVDEEEPVIENILYNFNLINNGGGFAVREIDDKEFKKQEPQDAPSMENFITPLSICATLTITEDSVADIGDEVVYKIDTHKGISCISNGASLIYFDNIGTVTVPSDMEVDVWDDANVDGGTNKYTISAGENKVSMYLKYDERYNEWKCNLVFGNHPTPKLYKANIVGIDISGGEDDIKVLVEKLDNLDTNNATYNDMLLYSLTEDFIESFRVLAGSAHPGPDASEEELEEYEMMVNYFTNLVGYKNVAWWNGDTYSWAKVNDPDRLNSNYFFTAGFGYVIPDGNGGFMVMMD